MIASYINPSHVTEEYEHRLHDSARNASFRSVRREAVIRRTLGRLIIVLSEFVHGHHPSTIKEPAAGQWVTD